MHLRPAFDLDDRGGRRHVEDAGHADEERGREPHRRRPAPRRAGASSRRGQPRRATMWRTCDERAVGDDERADHRPDAVDRIEQRELAVAPAERIGDEERQRDGEVVRRACRSPRASRSVIQSGGYDRDVAACPRAPRPSSAACGGRRTQLGRAASSRGRRARPRTSRHRWRSSTRSRAVTTSRPASAGPKTRDTFTIVL